MARHLRAKWFLAVCVWLLGCPAPAGADMRILCSNVEGYVRWAVVPGDSLGILPDGGVVEVLDLQTLKSRIFRGRPIPRHQRTPGYGRVVIPCWEALLRD
jgi:hypothetical protein